MNDDEMDSAVSRSVNILSRLGLTEYSARTYVALLRLGVATAREVSDISEVPRTKVYEEMERLHARGLVDIQNGSPKQFVPLTKKATTERFRRGLERDITSLSAALDDLEAAESNEKPKGVWTINGTRAIDDRLELFLEDADTTIRFCCKPEYFADPTVGQLQAAAGRGVDLAVGTIGDAPDFDPPVETTTDIDINVGLVDDLPTRILFVDQSIALVATASYENPGEEQAVWSTEPGNALVLLTRAMFIDR